MIKVEYDLLCNEEKDMQKYGESLLAVVVDDTTRASVAKQHIQNGSALIYQGDYHNARQLLAALKRRYSKNSGKTSSHSTTTREQWERLRQSTRRQTKELKMLMIQVDANHSLKGLRRAPNVQHILSKQYSGRTEAYVMPLRDLLGMIGAHEWYKKGIFLPQIGDFIHPHYGVFAPTRNEYLDLVERAAKDFFNEKKTEIIAMDIGIGTGVISALLLKKYKIKKLIGTDTNLSAIECSKENLERMGFTCRSGKIALVKTDLFPCNVEKAELIVCNPPWIPGKANSQLDRAVYDEGNASFLRRFLRTAKNHLDQSDHSEIWLVLSNLAELLGLRSGKELEEMIQDGGLEVFATYHTHPARNKAPKSTKSRIDHSVASINSAREAEVTTLYRLRVSSC